MYKNDILPRETIIVKVFCQNIQSNRNVIFQIEILFRPKSFNLFRKIIYKDNPLYLGQGETELYIWYSWHSFTRGKVLREG